MNNIISKLNKIVDNFIGYNSYSISKITYGQIAIEYNNFYDRLNDLLSIYNYEFVGQGRQRRVYQRGEFVLKIPHNIEGEYSNQKEALLYKANKKENFSPCRLFDKYLIMRKAHKLDHVPDWADYIDCQQVGITKYGKVVAYDYGN